MADEMVLETQKWLNENYGGQTGYNLVPENGQTGWPTIYGLIRALQLELGISSPSDNFGPSTSQLYDEKVTTTFGPNLDERYVHLIQGAFWCKGIDPGGFDGMYSGVLKQAVQELQDDAGFLNGSGILSSMWAKALFDMSAFVLVSGGDSEVRTMQQWLNANYYRYFGIMPCDGIYQRDTNSALIFALQAELDYSPEEATGSYGNGTTNATYTVSEGDGPTNYIRIIQYGLYVNRYYQKGSFDGVFSTYMGDEVENFREFMVLKPFNRVADVTVIKGLLSSAGDTNRWAIGADTSTQLDAPKIKTLTDNGVEIIGRYLTGTVGVGEDRRDKFMTSDELDNLFKNDISVFPIYQDGGWDTDYFTLSQGRSDGEIATKVALNLGIPLGTIIYFAVDVDVLGDDIDGLVIPYFRGVNSGISGYGVGVYGTRNVCSRITESSLAKFAFVSDMSTGYSGNLGFAMPENWAFDQFIEFTIGSGTGAVAIDNDASSGLDKGFNKIEDNGDSSSKSRIEYNKKVINQIQEVKSILDKKDLDNNWLPFITFYRYGTYFGKEWDILASPISSHDKEIFDTVFSEFQKEDGVYTHFIDVYSGELIGLNHLFVTLQCYLFLPGSVYQSITDFGGWLGDLLTAWKMLNDARNQVPGTEIDIESGIYTLVGTKEDSNFTLEDLLQDVDAFNLAILIKAYDENMILDFLLDYYTTERSLNRFDNFIDLRFGGIDKVYDITMNLLTNNDYSDLLGMGILEYFLQKKTDSTIPVFKNDTSAVAKGFSSKLKKFLVEGIE